MGDGQGVPRRVFQKPVKVFPSPNTNFAQLHSTDKQIHTHTHIIQRFMLKIPNSGQQHNFDLKHSLIG